MSISFAVDDVEPARSPRPTKPLAPRQGAHQALAADALDVIETPRVHPLLAAVHVAFAEHRPLVLSPDTIWLTIAQGVAQHVRLNAEKLHSRLVRHAGRQTITVRSQGWPTTTEDWQLLVPALRGALAELIGQGPARLLTCDFSTSSPAAALASEIVLLDVYSSYFDYEVQCVCGIPRITLTGTVADWREIRERIDVIAELELGDWTASLITIADRLVETAEGRPNSGFWRDIYKPIEAYGEDTVTGWIARLFPYLEGQGVCDVPNPLLAYRIGGLPRQKSEGWYEGPGIKASSAPLGCSEVLVTLRDEGAGGGDREVVLVGGLLGVSQDTEGALAAVPGWLVRPAPTLT